MAAGNHADGNYDLDSNDPSDTALDWEDKSPTGAAFASAHPPAPRPRLPYFRRPSGPPSQPRLDSSSPPTPDRPRSLLSSPPKVVIAARNPTGGIRGKLSCILNALSSALGLGRNGDGARARDSASVAADSNSALIAAEEAEAEVETADANNNGESDEGKDENPEGNDNEGEREEEYTVSDEAGEQRETENLGTQSTGTAWNFAAPGMGYYTESEVAEELEVDETGIERGTEDDEDEAGEAGEKRASAESNTDGQLPKTTTSHFYSLDIPLLEIEDGEVPIASPSLANPKSSWLSSDGGLRSAATLPVYTSNPPKQTKHEEYQPLADAASSDCAPISLSNGLDQPLVVPRDDEDGGADEDRGGQEEQEEKVGDRHIRTAGVNGPPEFNMLNSRIPNAFDRFLIEAPGPSIMPLPTVYGLSRPLQDQALQVWGDENEQPLSAQGNDTALLFHDADRLIPSIEVDHDHDHDRPNSSDGHCTSANNDRLNRRSDSATARASGPTKPSGRRPGTKRYNGSRSNKGDIAWGKANRGKKNGNNGNDSQRQRLKHVYSKPLFTTHHSKLRGAGDLLRGAFSHFPVTTDLLGSYSIQEPTTEDTEEDVGEEREKRQDGVTTDRLEGGPGGILGEGYPEGGSSAGGGPDNSLGYSQERDNDRDRFPEMSPDPPTPVEYPESPVVLDFRGQTPEVSPDPPTPREDLEIPISRELTVSPDPPTPVEFPETPILLAFGNHTPEVSPDPPTPKEDPELPVPGNSTISPDPSTPLDSAESRPTAVASTSRWSIAPPPPPTPSRPAVTRPRSRIAYGKFGNLTVPDASLSNSGPRASKRRRKRGQVEDGEYVNEAGEEDDFSDDDRNNYGGGYDAQKRPSRGSGGRKRKSPSSSNALTAQKRVLRNRTIGFSNTEVGAPGLGEKRAASPSDAGTNAKRAKPGTPAASGFNRYASTSLVENSVPSRKCSVYVLGENGNGQLGMGNGTPVQYKQPTKNTQLPDVVQVAAGGEHCIALTHDNKIYTWGDNSHGQLGRLTNSMTAQMPGEVDFSEVNLPDYTIFAQVVATRSACFVLTMFGDVYGWGTFSEIYEDENGEQHCEPLGFRHQCKCQRTPLHIQELQNVKRLAAGSDHVLAQISILIGGNRASSSASKMKGSRVRKRKDTIAAEGSSTGSATKVRDVVRSWGAYKRGQLGRTAANIANCLNPLLCDFPGNSSRALKNPDNVSTIGSGKFHSFVIKESGDFLAWGYNKFAQTAFVPPAASVLRRDLKVDKPSTVASLRGQRVHFPTGGVDFSVALTAGGQCLSWGSFQDGVRSIPDTAMSDEPDFNKVAGRDEGTQIPAIMKVPTFVPGINAHDKGIKMVSAGWTHTIAVTNGGKALGWGSNDHYEIHPDETKHPINDPMEIPMEGLRVVEAAAGRFFTILLVQSD